MNRAWIHTLSGFEDVLPIYQIDIHGNVYSYSKSMRGSTLKQSYNERGYRKVGLRLQNGRYINALIHRLVALAFVVGYRDGLQVDHLDGDNTNNESTNLMWKTPYSNTHNPNTFGKFIEANRLSHGARKVSVLDTATNKVKIYPSMSSACRAIGYRSNSISISDSKGYRQIGKYEVRFV